MPFSQQSEGPEMSIGGIISASTADSSGFACMIIMWYSSPGFVSLREASRLDSRQERRPDPVPVAGPRK